VIAGRLIAASSWAGALTFNGHQITILMALYGLIASVKTVNLTS
jgi:carbon starvation protein CstA